MQKGTYRNAIYALLQDNQHPFVSCKVYTYQLEIQTDLHAAVRSSK